MISPREPVSPRNLVRVMALLFAVILVFAAAAHFFSVQHRSDLITNGIRIQAQVISSDRRGGKNKITYQFEINNQHYIDTRSSQLEVKAGDFIEVVYLQTDPEVNDIALNLAN